MRVLHFQILKYFLKCRFQTNIFLFQRKTNIICIRNVLQNTQMLRNIDNAELQGKNETAFGRKVQENVLIKVHVGGTVKLIKAAGQKWGPECPISGLLVWKWCDLRSCFRYQPIVLFCDK